MFSLQTMRDHKKLKWPVRIGFALIIISFVPYYGWKSRSDREHGQVEFAKIRSESLNPLQRWTIIGPDLMKRAEERLIRRKIQLLPRQIAQTFNPSRLRDLVSLDEQRQEAANLLLIERIAQRLGVQVTFQGVIEMLRQQPGMTQQALTMIARQAGYADDPSGYVLLLQQQLLTDHVLAIVSQLAHASLFELWQEYKLDNEKVGLELAAYPVKDYENRVAVTGEDLANYLAGHKEQFHVPAKRQYAYVRLAKEDLRKQVKPQEDQLLVFYEKHQADFREQAGMRAEELLIPLSAETPTTVTRRALEILDQARAQAARADDWTTLARRLDAAHPDLQFFATTTPWLTGDSTQRSPEYLKLMLSLKDDRISSPMLDRTRAVIFRVKERRQASVPPLARIHSRVESACIDAKVNELFAEKAKAWREALKDAKQIGKFAQAVGARDELSTPVAVSAVTIPGIGNLTIARDYLPALLPDELSDSIQTGDLLVVLQVRNQTEGYDPPLAEARGEVDRALRRERAMELARLTARQNLNVVRGGADFKTVLADAPIKPFVAQPIRRNEPVQGLGEPLLNFREEAAGLQIGGAGMSPYGYDPDKPLGFAVWKVRSLTEPSRAQFAKERYRFEREYLQLQQLTMIEEWLADQRKQAKYEPIDFAQNR
jgi:hypothetical protein